MQTSEDKISSKNICLTALENLTEVKIKDLKINQIQKDTILWLKVYYDSFKEVGVSIAA